LGITETALIQWSHSFSASVVQEPGNATSTWILPGG
jgi:hypothetical protein